MSAIRTSVRSNELVAAEQADMSPEGTWILMFIV